MDEIIKKPTAIMVDIDGTLAHMDGRSPYDPTKYHTDKVDEGIRQLVELYHEHTHYTIIIMSGRNDTYEDTTVKWLTDNGVFYDLIYMRPASDKREDSIVKLELYEKYVKPKYEVRFVLDDRNRVVKMWRNNGLKCLQVAEGDF